MTSVRTTLIETIWRGADPFSGFPAETYKVDKQGWNDNHHYLKEAIVGDNLLVIEIGVWKGGSTIAMADQMRLNDMDAAILSVDTWLGSVEHWVEAQWMPHLGHEFGYPSIHRKFMANVIDAGLQEYVVPLPADSVNASQICRHYNLQADVIHIDAGHDYVSVMTDLRAWWPVLKEGGLYIGDDYNEGGVHWPEVYAAHNDFFREVGVTGIETIGSKCRVTKPKTASL